MELRAPPRNLAVQPPRKPKRRKSIMLRLLGFAFTAGVILFVAGSAVVAYMLWQISKDLPAYDKLADYEPRVMTRVHANDGSLIAEFARERRVYVPINAIPPRVINAFLAAEDKNFYEHGGLDFSGILRAIITNINNYGKGRRLVGASTITQQVAKNFLLTGEQEFARKIKEAILAVRIERAFDKQQILELYLNEIYLGIGAYGVASAALHYFDKELHELDIHEVAYLAALPKAPNNYHPVRQRKAAIERRNWVISRMLEDGHITAEEAARARQEPLGVTNRPTGTQIEAADYFAEQTRRALLAQFGEDKLYGGGLSVRTTLDPDMQKIARAALREGLLRYTKRQGWTGPVAKIDPGADWEAELAKMAVLNDLEPWRLAVVLEAGKEEALVGLRPSASAPTPKTVTIPFANLKWAATRDENGKSRRTKVSAASEILAPGDVVYVAPPPWTTLSNDDPEDEGKPDAKLDKKAETSWRLVQIPKIGGAIVVMDPHTGRVLALVGGFSFAESQFDRAVQARRQPGSSFKPFVYAAALDNGYTPSSIVIDAPLAIEQVGSGDVWRPKNYDGKIGGASTLRVGVEKSRNLMTVRLAQDLGMPIIGEYSRRFGIYDELLPVLSMALGAGETTLLRLTTAYCSFVNGGKEVQATLIDRIQDRYGKTIWKHDPRDCAECRADDWHGQDEPDLPDYRRQIIDPHTAYQMTSILEGAVRRGTGYTVSKVGKPLAGKTGTTNDEKDAWFVGFSPDLTVGVFVGFDTPTPMGKGETGGSLSAPIFRDFMKIALEGKPAVPFRVPPGIKLVRVNAVTGMRAGPDDPKTILEAFKPHEEPPDPFSNVGYGTTPEEIGGGFSSGMQSPGGDFGGFGRAQRAPSPGYGRQPQAGGLY